MKKRFNLTWRVVTALLLILALVPALVVGVAAAETTPPYLISISWIDVDASGTINPADNLIFYFSEAMDVSSLNEQSIINARLDSTCGGAGAGNDYGSTSASHQWILGDAALVVTLGADCRDTLPGKTVNPSADVKDKAGNSDVTAGTGPVIPISPDSADTYPPQLLSVTWLDNDRCGNYTANDSLLFHFSESMNNQSAGITITNANVDTYLGIESGRLTNALAMTWQASATVLNVTLGATTILGGEKVTPSLLDWHNNSCTSPTIIPTIPLTPNAAGPVLLDVVWYDNGNSGTVNQGDWLIFRFSETVCDPLGYPDCAANMTNYFTTPNSSSFWGGPNGSPTAFGKDVTGSMWKLQFGANTSAQIGNTITPTANLTDKGCRIATGSGTISTSNKVTTDITSSASNSMDVTAPYLRSISWWDMNINGIYDQADELFFYWSESINQGTLPAYRAYINERLNSTSEPGSIDYGTGPNVSAIDEEWLSGCCCNNSSTNMMLRIALKNNEYIFGGETVDPSNVIQDPKGNADGTTPPGPRIPYAPDTTLPTLLSIGWNDVDVNGIINVGDRIIFRFSEAMRIANCGPNYDVTLPISGNDAAESWGPGALFGWQFGDIGGLYGSQLTITLGADETIDGGELVNPSGAVTDAKGNPDNTATPGGIAIPLPPDKIPPTLQNIVWIDSDGNAMINALDHLVFSFSEAMNASTILIANVGAQLESTAAGTGADYGAGANLQVIWNGPVNTQCTVILGAGETITGGEWVNPNSALVTGVLDAIGNPDGSIGGGVQIPSVAGTPATIVRAPASLAFTAVINGSNPTNQAVSISNSGQQILNWTATKTAAWLNITPTSGANTGTVTCSVDISGLNVSTYTDTITIAASGATNTPQTVAVTLTITAPVTPTPTTTANASPTPTATANVTPTPTVTVGPTVTPTTIPPTPTTTPVTYGTGTVATTGGTVATGDGKVEVTFPAGAFTSSTTVTIASASCHGDTDAFVVGSTCFRVTPDGALGAAATICVELSSYDLSLGDEGDLTLGYWSDGEWHAVSSEINGNTICGTTNHLSDWAVLSSTGGGWLWWYWALIGGGAFIVVLAIILLLVLPKKGKGEEIPSEELYGEEEEEF